MCKVYNSIGSLTSLMSHLLQHNIDEFKSLQDILDFQNSYPAYRQQIILDHQNLIEQEKNNLQSDLLQLETTIEEKKIHMENELTLEINKLKERLTILATSTPTNFIHRFTKLLKEWYYKKVIRHDQINFDSKIAKSLKKITDIKQEKNNRYQFIISHFDDAVNQSCAQSLTELERKKRTIEEVNSFIYGALGEQKVVKELENLSDDYFLINDFSISFSTPVYNRQENDYIKSIQIDHILVSSSGIFIIETKNWSEKSLDNLSLRSPVQQIRRTSFVLFKMLNDKITNYNLHLDKHHWGIKKIPMRNLIVLINSKPREEFQYVKVLTLNELLGYVKYFKPIFSNIEAQRITDYLININNQKIIAINRN
jgi:hypothetical protein